MKKTLLQIVQSILNDMDSEDVNSLSDSTEAEQVARVVETCYYNLVATTDIPEHYEFRKLVSKATTDLPTFFEYPANCKHLSEVWYDVATTGDPQYRKITFLPPSAFVALTDRASTYDLVTEPTGGIKLRIANDRMPTYYTSFDDDTIVFDSYDNSVDLPLQASKTRCYGDFLPSFTITDTFVPDLDAVYFPYLIAESKSTCFDLFKGGTTQKVDQQARRQKHYIQNNKYKTTRARGPAYGRRTWY